MAINKISELTKKLIKEQSVLAIPDRPTEKGYTAKQLKEIFTDIVLGDQGALTEIDRITEEINLLVGDIENTTIRDYVINSIMSKFVEQSPIIALTIADRKLKYTKFGTPNTNGDLDYIPDDSVFFNTDTLKDKNDKTIYPKTSIDQLIDKLDDKSVREYILGLNTKIETLLQKHEREIASINSNIEAILGGDAPEALDSIKELAEALKNNPTQLDDILLQISTIRDGKVDKIDGKQLSTNDYDDETKAFIDNIKSKDIVLKDELKTNLSDFKDDSEHRLVSDSEKQLWNSKADQVHKHVINDINGLKDELDDKSDINHTHNPEQIGAEKSGTAASEVAKHNSDSNAHDDIRAEMTILTGKVNGINNAISFETEQQLKDWLVGTYDRTDGFMPSDMFVGQHIYIRNLDENDYWVIKKPVNTIEDLDVLETDKIDLDEYVKIDSLSRVAFTGNHSDLNNLPNIPTTLAELNEDENHKTISQDKINQIDSNSQNLANKVDKNLGANEANKMLVTDGAGNIVTAMAGSMSALVDNLESESTTMAPTANQVRILNNKKVDKQFGVENAGKILKVNDSGVVEASEEKTKISQFENDKNYQTLSQVQEIVNAIPTPDVSGQIQQHNNSSDAHQDIRDVISNIANKSDIAIASSNTKYAVSTSSDEISSVNLFESKTSNSTVRMRGCAYGNGIYVITGTSGAVQYSTDKGQTWQIISAFTANVIVSVTYGGGYFICVDSAGGIFKSADCISWTQLSSPTSDIINSIVYINGKFALVGSNGLISFSNDGEKFTLMNSGVTNELTSITRGLDKYVAVSTAGDILVSINGTDWTNNSVDSTHYRTATFGKNIFVIGGQSGKIKYSSDAIHWTDAVHDSTSSVNYIRDIKYANGKFYAVMYISTGEGEIWTSLDGASWMKTQNTAGRLWCLGYGNDILFASGDNGAIWVLDLDINWLDTQPTITTGQYIWSKEIYYLTDGSVVEGEVEVYPELTNLENKIPTDYVTNSELNNYVTKDGFTMRASSTAGKFYYNTGNGEQAVQIRIPASPVTSVNGQTGDVVIDIPDTSGFAKTSDLNNYLPLTGGNLTGRITVNASNPSVFTRSNSDTPILVDSTSSSTYIQFASGGVTKGYIGVNSVGKPVFYDTKDRRLAFLEDIPKLVTLTQAEYDALATKDANTYYFIKEE